MARIMTSIRKFESGQVFVLATGAILIMIGMAALAVDIGFLYATRRNMQTAADAAAIAGANALQAKLTCDSGSCPAAQDVAKLNGFTNGGPNSTTVTVGPPTVVPSPSNGTYIQVSVSQTVPTYFMGALGFSTVSLGATAVAGFVPTPNCVIQLNQNLPNNALVVSGSGNLTAQNCNVAVDDRSPSGLVVSGSGVINAGSVGVAAPSESSASDASSPGGPGVSPAFVTNAAVVADPYADLAPPSPCASRTVGGCTAVCDAAHTNFTPTTSQTISAGTYCGGITVNKNITLTLGPGTYVLVGGGLVESSGTITDGTIGTTAGAGVTFYLTYPTGNPGKYNTLNVNGGSTLNASAPGSGDFKGVLFFQDPTAGGSNPGNQKDVISASNGTLNGALYFPTQNLIFQGNTSVSVENVQLIADSITVSGAANIGTPTLGTVETTGITTTKLYE
jgi:Flp pilus assembly protein TadG